MIDCNFVGIYDRYFSEGYLEGKTKNEVLQQLVSSEDNGDCFAIAIIDCSTKKMVWHQDHIGKVACRKRAKKFIDEKLDKKQAILEHKHA